MSVICASLLAIGLLCSSATAVPSTAILDATRVVARDGSGSVVTSPAALQWYSTDFTVGATPRNVSAYTCYKGPAANFPPMDAWISFDDMWAVQRKYALSTDNDTAEEVDDIHTAIMNISAAAKVDARVILSVIIHESFGNVNVPCTYSSYKHVHNCGLMQSFNATDMSYDPEHPLQSITQMITDGTQGTIYGPGLVQLFNNAPDTNEEADGNVYKVFRAYNSGSVDSDNLSDGEGALDSYVSDMANFLQGWNGYGTAPSACNFSTTATTTAPTCASTAYVAAPTATMSGSTPDCCSWHTVESGDSCYSVDRAAGITFAQLQSWNTYIDTTCDNLPAGYAVCVSGPVEQRSSSSSVTSTLAHSSTTTAAATTVTSSLSTSTPPTTCASGEYVSPPASTQSGSTANCCSWYVVQSGDSCYSVDLKSNITFAQLQAWNTYIDSSCDNLWADSAVCVDSNVPVGKVTTTTASRTTTVPTTTSSLTSKPHTTSSSTAVSSRTTSSKPKSTSSTKTSSSKTSTKTSSSRSQTTTHSSSTSTTKKTTVVTHVTQHSSSKTTHSSSTKGSNPSHPTTLHTSTTKASH